MRNLAAIFFLLCAFTVSSEATVIQEAFLKQSNMKIANLLKDSLEARTFIEEDLLDATLFLDKAKIVWTDSISEMPLIFSAEGSFQILLSEYFSFSGSPEQKIATILSILFQMKRQMENSTLSIPKVRIQLFSKKFSDHILNEAAHCNYALNPLDFPLTRIEKDGFLSLFYSLLASRNFMHVSKNANFIFVPEIKKSTDAECRGNNRNIIKVKLSLINLSTLTSQVLSEVTETNCKDNNTHLELALKKTLKKLKHSLTSCNSALETF